MRRSALFAAVLVVVAQKAGAADWPAFRGPAGNGFSDETNVPTEWSKTENVRWVFPLPDEGNSSPVIVGDRVLVTCAEQKGTKRHLYCINRATGKEMWRRTVEAQDEPTHGTNPYCAPTPATDGKLIVVWHGSAGLYCYDMTGKEIWRQMLGEFRHQWGYAASPVIYKDSVIQNCAPGKEAFIAAFKLATGQEMWRVSEPADGNGQSRSDGAPMGTWSTPLLLKLDGEDQIVCSQPNRVVGYRPANGEIIWQFKTRNRKGDLAYSSPTIGDGICIAQGGYNGGGTAFKLGGKGDLTETAELWHKPQNPQSIGTGVIIDGHWYVPDAGPNTIRCIEVATNTEKWNYRDPSNAAYWGSIVVAEGRAYVTNQRGATIVFRPNPQMFDLVARNELNEHSNSTPAISDGQIFIRTFENLYCIGGDGGSR